MQTCALADDCDVVDDDPLVTTPMVRRSVPWSHPLPPIPPLHEHIEFAAHAIRARLRSANALDTSALVPGSVAFRLWVFMCENYPSPALVAGPVLRDTFMAANPNVNEKTYAGALLRLRTRRLIVSTRVVGTNRCTYRAVRA